MELPPPNTFTKEANITKKMSEDMLAQKFITKKEEEEEQEE